MFLHKYLKRQVKKEFATKLGISRRALDYYANGDRMPPMDVAFRIQEVTKNIVTVEELFEWYNLKKGKSSPYRQSQEDLVKMLECP